jgi:hypothetical protein
MNYSDVRRISGRDQVRTVPEQTAVRGLASEEQARVVELDCRVRRRGGVRDVVEQQQRHESWGERKTRSPTAET